jgi:hypothetical protein
MIRNPFHAQHNIVTSLLHIHARIVRKVKTKKEFSNLIMEYKLESPDYQFMDISEAGTTLDNISTSSVSPTISNQAENEIDSGEKSDELVVETVTKNMNTIQLTSSVDSRNNLTLDTNVVHHQTQKLTPVHHHPLMFDNDEESEDSCNNTNVSNFPDVVLSHSRKERTTAVKAKADLVNIHNNNIKSRKPIYRAPSPVSRKIIIFVSFTWEVPGTAYLLDTS